jgi:hypothetical protein
LYIQQKILAKKPIGTFKVATTSAEDVVEMPVSTESKSKVSLLDMENSALESESWKSELFHSLFLSKENYDYFARFNWIVASKGIGKVHNASVYNDFVFGEQGRRVISVSDKVRREVIMGANKGKCEHVAEEKEFVLFTNGLTSCTGLGLVYEDENKEITDVELIHFAGDYLVSVQGTNHLFGGGPEKFEQIRDRLDSGAKAKAVFFGSSASCSVLLEQILVDTFLTGLSGKIEPEDITIYLRKDNGAINVALTSTGLFGEIAEGHWMKSMGKCGVLNRLRSIFCRS